MDLKAIGYKLKKIIQKYKYALLILILGIAFMALPGKDQLTKQSVADNKYASQDTAVVSVGEELEQLLGYIDGAGAVKVLLTEASGQQTVYQTNTDRTQSDGGVTEKNQTVTVTDSDRAETGLILQRNPPKYLGAIILCQGAEDPGVKLAITQAVSKATGLGADKIAVLKMK